MKLRIDWNGKTYEVDRNEPLDLSIPLQRGKDNPNAFGIQWPEIEPYRSGDWIASVDLGSPVNCENIFLNPHGNGTHTECIGHISPGRLTINQHLQEFLLMARLVSLPVVEESSQNRYLSAKDLPNLEGVEALIIRSRPNKLEKKLQNYSGAYPTYIEPALCERLSQAGVRHVLVDLPSVDPEKDDGKMLAHKAFWAFDGDRREFATITEMIYVPDEIQDGDYLLNLQIAPIESDASPSKPVIYRLKGLE